MSTAPTAAPTIGTAAPTIETEPATAPTSTSRSTPSALAPSGPFDVDEVTLRGPDGQRSAVGVYVADEPVLRQRGLMGVTDLPDDAGMVFRFDGDTTSAFTMRNTLIPLSIAFAAADGEILEILDMQPCEAEPCPPYDPEVTYRTALEVPQGAFDRAGVTVGWILDDS
jgi:uncharacterized membrane protein (UPF0127 family)